MGLPVENIDNVRNLEYKIDETWKMERQILCQLINEGYTRQSIANETELNRKYISQYSNGKCYEKVEDVEAALRKFFKKIGRWPEEVKASGCKTSADEIGIVTGINDFYRAKAICERSHTKREITLLYGNPGTGKTVAISEYARSHENALMVTCSRNTRTKTLLKKIAEALGIMSYGNTGDLEMRISKEIRRKLSPTLIIIDEADFLNINSLETLRTIYDEVNPANETDINKKKLGIVLCGNAKLYESIMVYAAEHSDYARLRDRIGYYQKMSGLGALEAEKFLDGINCTKDAKQLLMQIGVNRGIRQLVMALRRLLDVTEGKLITGSLVEELGQIVLSFNG